MKSTGSQLLIIDDEMRAFFGPDLRLNTFELVTAPTVGHSASSISVEAAIDRLKKSLGSSLGTDEEEHSMMYLHTSGSTGEIWRFYDPAQMH